MGAKKVLTPKFESEEKEAEHWDTHSPLDRGAEPKAQKLRVRGAKDRPVTIRLDSQTRLKLEELAAQRGVGPSTLARSILLSAIEHQNEPPKSVNLGELMNLLQKNMTQPEIDKFESFLKDIAIGDLDNPALLVFSGQRRTWENFTSLFLERLFALLGIKVVIPQNEDYEKVREIVKCESRE
jgi:hypothetical protein